MTLDLEAQERRLAALTLPWRKCGAKCLGDPCTCGLVWSVPSDAVVAVVRFRDEDGEWRRDAYEAHYDFIAHAPEDLAACHAEIRRLRGELDAARAEVERLRGLIAQHIRVADESTARIAALVTERERLREAMRIAEWSDGDDGNADDGSNRFCPACGANEDNGHNPRCSRDADFARARAALAPEAQAGATERSG